MLEPLIKLVAALIFVLLALVIGIGLWRLIEIPIRRGRQSIFDYVYVDDDGNARELNDDEREYVTSALFPDEETGEVIKSSYESLNPDGRLRGYLRRNQLPRHISITALPQ